MKKSTVLCAAVGIVSACLVAAPVAAGPASAHEADRVADRFEVTAKVSNAEPEQGSKIELRGEVKPARPGQQVVLQLRYGKSGKWTTTNKTDVLNSKSKFKIVDEVSSVRFRQYRVLKPASPGIKSGKSPKVGVTVYGWRRLTSLTPADSNAMREASSVKINAVDYPASLLASYDDEGSIDYNLNRGCKLIEGRYGLDDSSETTATGTVELEADSESKYSHSFVLTQSQFVRHDVTGVFRITIRWSSENTEGTPTDQSGAWVAVGTPRVLCNF